VSRARQPRCRYYRELVELHDYWQAGFELIVMARGELYEKRLQ
jgi:hypothetical protein